MALQFNPGAYLGAAEFGANQDRQKKQQMFDILQSIGSITNSLNQNKRQGLMDAMAKQEADRKNFLFNRQYGPMEMPQEGDSYNPFSGINSPDQFPSLGTTSPNSDYSIGNQPNKLSLFSGNQGMPQMSGDLVAAHKAQFPHLADIPSQFHGGQNSFAANSFAGGSGGPNGPWDPRPGQSRQDYEDQLRYQKEQADIDYQRSHAGYLDKGGSRGLTGATSSALLDTATPNEINMAKALVEGKIRPSSFSARGGERSRMISLAQQYADKNNMVFNDYSGDVKSHMAIANTSGKLGMNALSLNTALGHTGDLIAAFDNLGNTDSALLNKPINWLKENSNDPNIISVGLNLNALRGELANVFKNSGGTDQEIAQWGNYLNENLTPAQARAAVEKVDQLLVSRSQALDYQKNNVMNDTIGNREFLSPHAKEVQQKIRAGGQDMSLMYKGRPLKDTPANRAWLAKQRGQ